MAAFDTNHIPLISIFGRLSAKVTGWNNSRKTRNSLGRLSDRELSDIGLLRGTLGDMKGTPLVR